ncbi:MAG: hypothetical protein Q7T83_13340 [Thermodesulfovibrionales bacterium]|nr:hypothetical protein [Thermodesulfovibrionales bacterium]
MESRKEEKVMKLQEIKGIAKKMGIKAGSMKKTELIRVIQRAEGNVSAQLKN